MKKIFGKLKHQSRPVAASIPEPKPLAVNPLDAVRLDRFGLIHLGGKNLLNSNDSEHYPVDIIAVHGLNGDAYTTWTHNNGKLWLRDFLVSSLPGCRVFTYGYPSQIFSESIVEVKGYARRLLGSIRDLQRNEPGQGTRRIIFVCHSLGGIVCKQALVIAHEDSSSLDDVRLLKSVAGIVFLGTPHRGSSIASLGALVGRIINVFLVAKSIRTDHLRYLEYESKALQDLTDSACNRLANIKIVSFYETKPEPALPFVIVDKASATLALPGEDIYPLYATHRDLCRFPSEGSEYSAVLGAIRSIIAHTAQRISNRASTHSSQKSWDASEKSCMWLFSRFDVSDYQTMLPTPAKGTCQWILGHPLFVSWVEKAKSALLWLTGPPGCGKTMLSFFLAKQLDSSPKPLPSNNVCVFFCDDKISNQKDANSILIGLIFQLVRRHKSLVRHIRKVYDMHGQNTVQSFTALWTIFRDITTDPRSKHTIVIIDALDECEEDSRRLLLSSIKILIQNQDLTAAGREQVKFLLTSRPNLTEVERMIDGVSVQRIPIDDAHGGYNKDVQIFIQEKLDEISKQRQLPPDVKDWLRDSLCSRSGQTFLWVHMVLTALDRNPLLSSNDLESFIQRIPPNLEMIYLRFVSDIQPHHQKAASKLLELILGSTRHLTLDEINIAFSIETSHHTVREVNDSCQTGMTHTLQSILGALVRISDSKVSLVHQSAKEFILQRPGAKKELPPAIRTIGEEGCALTIATSCVNYLLLDDFTQDLFASKSSPAGSISEESDLSEISPSFVEPFWDHEEDAVHAADIFKDSSERDCDTCHSLASKYPFYRYAALHWTSHFERCESYAPAKLSNAVKALLNIHTTNCSNWLRFHSTEAATGDQGTLRNFDTMTLAAFFNFHETLKDYLQSPDSISQEHLDNALFWGATQGHDRVVNTLLRAKANPNARVSGRQTALMVASRNGHSDCVRTLQADDRTDLNLMGDRGRTALSFACYGGHKEIVKTLVSRKDCNIDEEDDSGSTPLIWAAGGGHTEIVNLLARHPNVNVNHCDKMGRTVVSWAAGDGMYEVLKALLKVKGVDANLKDKEGLSPLSWAARNGCAAAVRVLLRDSKVDKADVDKKLRNAISWACERGHAEALRMLLKYGCPGVDESDESGWTPLAWAIQNDSPEVVETLVSTKSVDLERRDHSGRTALSWAVSYGHIEVVKTLLRAGADPRARSVTGITPMSAAESMGRTDIMEELVYFMGGSSS